MEKAIDNYMWDQTYNTDKFVYGTEPNIFFAENLKNFPPGKILFPAEGEGRNAVHAALQDWDVHSFDLSAVGKQKAEILAEDNNVEINYLNGTFEKMPYQPESFDCIVLIYAHFPKHRELYHQIVAHWLKPGGIVILEGFSKKQMDRTSGGPKDPEMLFSEEEIRSDFKSFRKVFVEEQTITLDEGPAHQGEADVVRMIGVK